MNLIQLPQCTSTLRSLLKKAKKKAKKEAKKSKVDRVLMCDRHEYLIEPYAQEMESV